MGTREYKNMQDDETKLVMDKEWIEFESTRYLELADSYQKKGNNDMSIYYQGCYAAFNRILLNMPDNSSLNGDDK